MFFQQLGIDRFVWIEEAASVKDHAFRAIKSFFDDQPVCGDRANLDGPLLHLIVFTNDIYKAAVRAGLNRGLSQNGRCHGTGFDFHRRKTAWAQSLVKGQSHAGHPLAALCIDHGRNLPDVSAENAISPNGGNCCRNANINLCQIIFAQLRLKLKLAVLSDAE